MARHFAVEAWALIAPPLTRPPWLLHPMTMKGRVPLSSGLMAWGFLSALGTSGLRAVEEHGKINCQKVPQPNSGVKCNHHHHRSHTNAQEIDVSLVLREGVQDNSLSNSWSSSFGMNDVSEVLTDVLWRRQGLLWFLKEEMEAMKSRRREVKSTATRSGQSGQPL